MSEYICCLCKKAINGIEAYEYRGFTSCDEHFDEVGVSLDIENYARAGD